MKTTLTFAAAAATLAIAGCGGSDNNSGGGNTGAAASTPAQTTPANNASGGASGGKSTSLKLSADPSGALKFDKSSLSAKAGNVTITMANPSDVPHGVAVDGNGVDKDGPTVNKGGTSTVTVSLKKGKYSFYCPVPGHRQA